MPAKCHVLNCTAPAVAKGLCEAHYKRQGRHGHTEQTRPADWGRREQHPAYKAWCGLRRVYSQLIPPSWREDFWAFVAEVPEKPEGRSSVFRPDRARPWGPDNFYWKVPRHSKEALADKAAYARVWQRSMRAANPEHGKAQSLRRSFGVTLEWYNELHAQQKGLCAICAQPETRVIRGKVLALAVDHCHDTGRVRRLLCMACNQALGLFNHDPERLRRAIDYLKEF